MDQTDLSAIIARQVRAARAAAGLTRRELAARAAVSERYLSQLESGEANVSIGILVRVAGALGRDVTSFLTDTPGAMPHPVSPALDRLVASLSPGEQASVLPLIESHVRERRRNSRGIALLGLRGAGKTTIGTAFAKRRGLRFVSVTREIEARAGMGLVDLFNLGGQDTFRSLEIQVIGEIVRGSERVVLETSGGIVGNAEALEAILASFRTIWLTASPEEHLQRVTGQGDLRPMHGNPTALEHLKALLARRQADYARAEAVLDTSGRTVEACVAELERLAGPP